MAEIVNTLFGITPRSAEQQLRQQDVDLGGLFAAATVNPYAAVPVQNAYRDQQAAQFALGSLGTRALGGMFGLQDPTIKRATEIESILNQTQMEAGDDPVALYTTLANKLGQAGYGREASMAAQEAQKLAQASTLNQAKVQNELSQATKFEAEAQKALREDDVGMQLFKELAKKSTPKAVAEAIRNGYDISFLDSQEAQKLSPLAQQLIDSGYVYGSPEFNAEMRRMLEAERSGKSKGSGNVNVSVGIDSGKVSEEAGKAVGKAVADIENKYVALDSVAGAIAMVDQGINAGFYGPAQQLVTKASKGMIGSPEKVQNTERFLSYVGNTVIPRLQEFGGNDSVEELKYLRQVMAGETTLEPQSIKEILRDAEIKIQRGIERLQRQENAAMTGGRAPLDPGPSRGTEAQKKRKVYVNGKWVEQ